MTNLRKHAEQTSEVVRDLVSQVILKHEMAVLEILIELQAENVRLQAELAVLKARHRLIDTGG